MGEIRFVGTGETRGYLYLVCKNLLSNIQGVLNQVTTYLFLDLFYLFIYFLQICLITSYCLILMIIQTPSFPRNYLFEEMGMWPILLHIICYLLHQTDEIHCSDKLSFQ